MTDKGKTKVEEKEKAKENVHTEEKKSHKKVLSKEKYEKKIKDLEEKVQKLQEENESLREQNLRRIAEFENFKRRKEKEFLSVLQNANEELILELLPVVDDFERFLAHVNDPNQNVESLKQGIELIYKKFMQILEKQGLKPIEAVGSEFDAEKHQALMQVDSDKHESGYIVDEHLKGYTLNDKVIRHAQVLVAK
ncbi:MAG: nucleotide exchange factor GrpE [Calditrichaeota bacterium]|nr:nucleotide exchange factor GrpE [Calditrichota bacterium]